LRTVGAIRYKEGPAALLSFYRAIMKKEMQQVRAPVRAMFTRVIDYAGLFQPAGLELPEVIDRYERYRASPEGWILNRLVLPETLLGSAPVGPGWRVSLLVAECEPEGPLPPEVEVFETKYAHHLSLPTY